MQQVFLCGTKSISCILFRARSLLQPMVLVCKHKSMQSHNANNSRIVPTPKTGMGSSRTTGFLKFCNLSFVHPLLYLTKELIPNLLLSSHYYLPFRNSRSHIFSQICLDLQLIMLPCSPSSFICIFLLAFLVGPFPLQISSQASSNPQPHQLTISSFLLRTQKNSHPPAGSICSC